MLSLPFLPQNPVFCDDTSYHVIPVNRCSHTADWVKISHRNTCPVHGVCLRKTKSFSTTGATPPFAATPADNHYLVTLPFTKKISTATTHPAPPPPSSKTIPQGSARHENKNTGRKKSVGRRPRPRGAQTHELPGTPRSQLRRRNRRRVGLQSRQFHALCLDVWLELTT